MDNAEKILSSRTELCRQMPVLAANTEEEGGCGVTGFICSIPVTGKNIFEPSVQMHNRGNGKGGGIGAVGFIPEALGVSRQVLDEDYMFHIALLDAGVADELENTFIKPYFKIDKSEKLATLDDHRSIGLDVRPPDVMRYFVRVKDDVLDKFIAENHFTSLDRRDAEDEFVYQNSFKINKQYYASLGEKKAFVMSHGRNMMILKIVGYAENVVRYYKLDDFKAYAWLAHQRYPTRGRVWHPGGCHPFSALNEALVHNGDFANYQSVLRISQTAQLPPPVSDRYGGGGAPARSVEQGLQISPGIPDRGHGADLGDGLRHAAGGKAGAVQGHSDSSCLCHRPTGRGSSLSPAMTCRTISSS